MTLKNGEMKENSEQCAINGKRNQVHSHVVNPKQDVKKLEECAMGREGVKIITA